ncbi:hypothetical protein MJT46_012824 [Ovis ammon polii x Ovis aries]|nr:hypothetical protein MJT46_012824 [Ovis ammon polii x Ovis aries]
MLVMRKRRPPHVQPSAHMCFRRMFSAQSGGGVCCLVLAVLSLWPDRAAAPGPPPAPPRASPDPRAELDSAVLLTRSLLADTRQLAAQLRDKFPADGDHSLDSLPTLAMSAGALGALQMSRLALPQAPPDPPAPPLAPPASAWGGIRAAHAILGGLQLTLDWAVRGLLLLKTRL